MPAETPSIFLCGPQTSTVPPQEYFVQLRKDIRQKSTLETIEVAVAELPTIWAVLVKEHPALSELPGAVLLRDLKEWITGESDSLGNSKCLISNMHLGPLTVVVQLMEYLNYLTRSEVDHREMVSSVAHGGFQGLCTGFLTASALSCSRDTAEIGKQATVALRLALCLGAMVDLDNQCGVSPARLISMTTRWTSATDRSKVMAIIAGHQEAYLSINMDAHSMAITAPEADLPSIFHELSRIGVQVTAIGSKGRYNHPQNSTAMQIAHKVFAASPDLFQFPGTKHALVPLRSNDSGALVSPGEPLHETALRCSLLEMADWHATVSTAVATVRYFAPSHTPLILGLGLVECVPESLVSGPRGVAVYRRALGPRSHCRDPVAVRETSRACAGRVAPAGV